MKTRRILPVLLAILLLPVILFGKGVTSATAIRVAQNFCILHGFPAALVADTETSTPGIQENPFFKEKLRLYYRFQLAATGGFILVAADDRIPPVLGYSFTGTSTPAAIPLSCRNFLQEIERGILEMIHNNTDPGPGVVQSWNQLTAPVISPVKPAHDLAPLILTRWNQGCFCNAGCPNDTSAHNSCLHALAGSGATAMAQVMKFYHYPAHGTGEHGYVHPKYGIQYANFGATSYNFSLMPDTISSLNDNVSTLIYQCGVAQNMNYGVQGSQSDSSVVDSALVKYFSFPATALWKWKSGFTTAEWLSMLKTELDAAHPLIYHGGSGTSGGYFICDGYQGNDFFHFNWGLGGSWDGFFYLNNLAPGSNNFTSSQGAVFNLAPSGQAPDTYTMDFESVADFSLTFNDWSVKDVDQHGTYGITNYNFPHQTEAMAFLAFNPAQVSPSMSADQAIQPHGGLRFGACFNSNPPANDDWFISPQIQLGTNGTFSFWIKSYNDLYGLDNYTVAVSTTGNSPGNFTVISGSQPLQTTLAWTKKIFGLAGYNNQKVYVAIHCVSNDHFLMMIDDLEVKTHGTTALTADFAADKVSLMAGDSVTFTDQSSGTPTSWKWSFPGGSPSSSSLQSPSKIHYNLPGSYPVQLKVTNGTTSDSITRSGYISVTAFPSSMSLDFESLADFTLSFNPWTVNDVGGGNTYGVTSVTFPNAYYPMAYICFNPANTIPPMTSMTAHSGLKMGCCFSSTPPKNPNNKWLITPRMTLGTSPLMEFWVKTFNPQFGYEMYNVAVSTTDLAPSSFVPLTAAPESAPGDWTKRSYNLSVYTHQNVYIGIQCVTNDGFVLMLDDISITSAVGVDEHSSLVQITIFPNPAGDYINLACGRAFQTPVTATLFNTLGERVRSWDNPAFSGNMLLDTRYIPGGMYLLQVSSGNERVTRKVSIVH